MVEVLAEESIRFADPDTLEAQVREYAMIQETEKQVAARKAELKEKLFATLDLDGVEDETGSKVIEFGTPINGVIRLIKQRRVSRKLNEDLADEVIATKELEDEVYRYVKTIDEDALMAAMYEGKITENDLDTIYPITVTWALTPKKR